MTGREGPPRPCRASLSLDFAVPLAALPSLEREKKGTAFKNQANPLQREGSGVLINPPLKKLKRLLKRSRIPLIISRLGYTSHLLQLQAGEPCPAGHGLQGRTGGTSCALMLASSHDGESLHRQQLKGPVKCQAVPFKMNKAAMLRPA